MSSDPPGAGFFGWLGRQIGYVKRAIKSDPAGLQKIYRNETVEERSLPSDPSVKLRRTTIDEAIVDPSARSPAPPHDDRADRSEDE